MLWQLFWIFQLYTYNTRSTKQIALLIYTPGLITGTFYNHIEQLLPIFQ